MNSALKIPGYSGFIPLKQDIVGHTVGEVNRQAGDCFRYRNRTGMAETGSAIFQQQMLATKMRSNTIDGSAEPYQK